MFGFRMQCWCALFEFRMDHKAGIASKRQSPLPLSVKKMAVIFTEYSVVCYLSDFPANSRNRTCIPALLEYKFYSLTIDITINRQSWTSWLLVWVLSLEYQKEKNIVQINKHVIQFCVILEDDQNQAQSNCGFRAQIRFQWKSCLQSSEKYHFGGKNQISAIKC